MSNEPLTPELIQEQTREELEKRLQALELIDAQNCIKEIETVLEKYGCVQVIHGQFVGSQFQSGILVQKKK